MARDGKFLPNLCCQSREAIVDLIEPMAWGRCDAVTRAEQASLKGVLDGWGSASL